MSKSADAGADAANGVQTEAQTGGKAGGKAARASRASKAAAPAPAAAAPAAIATGNGAAANGSDSFGHDESSEQGLKVIRWGVDGSETADGTDVEAEVAADDGNAEEDQAASEVKAGKTGDHEDAGEGEDASEDASEDEETEERPQLLSASQRQEKLAALRAERERRAAEEALKAAKNEKEALEKRLRSGKLDEKLKAIGLTREQALEQLMFGGDDAGDDDEGEAEKPSKGKKKPDRAEDPEIAELKRRLDELTADKERSENERKAAVIRQASEAIAEAVKDSELPLLKAAGNVEIPLPAPVATKYGKLTGYQFVLAEAQVRWQQSGQRGRPFDFVPAAAKAVEAYLSDMPLVKAARGGSPAKPEPAEQPRTEREKRRARSIGKRGSRAMGADTLDGVYDRNARTAQIIKEMGWDR